MYKPNGCDLRILIHCPPPPALVQIARGSGATVGNSVVMPSTERAVAFSVDDCSPKLRVGHFHDVDPSAFAAKSNDAVSIDDRVAVAGLGDDPPTKISDYRNYDGSWSRHVVDSSPTPFDLGAGCEEAPLWRVNRNPPEAATALDPKAFDPRTAAMVVAALDPVPPASSTAWDPKEAASRLDPRATVAMAAAARARSRPAAHRRRRGDGRRDARATWMLDAGSGLDSGWGLYPRRCTWALRPDTDVDGSIAHDESTYGSIAANQDHI